MNFLSKESLMIGGVLGGIALILTFFAGLFGGLSFGKVLVNSFFFTFLLGLVGVGAAVILEKMIPSIWASDSGEQGDEDGETSSQAGSSEGSVDFTVGDEEDLAKGSSDYFPEMETQMTSADVGTEDEDGAEDDGSLDASSYKSDASHLMSTKVNNGYREINGKKFLDDPEEYAKAIKTMLLKDD